MPIDSFLKQLGVLYLPCKTSEADDDDTVKTPIIQRQIAKQTAIESKPALLEALAQRRRIDSHADISVAACVSKPPRAMRLVKLDSTVKLRVVPRAERVVQNRALPEPVHLQSQVVTARPAQMEFHAPVQPEASVDARTQHLSPLLPADVPFEWDGSTPDQATIQRALTDAVALLARTEDPSEARRRSGGQAPGRPEPDDYDADPDRMMVKRYIALIKHWDSIDETTRVEIEDPELLPLGKAVTYLNYVIHTWDDVKGKEPKHAPPPRPPAMLERTRREIYWQECVDCITVYSMVEKDLKQKLSSRSGVL
ncbi:hypothetical protein LJR230_002161 [Trinickia sp. LjRoot230]|uniref:hypothetical protein n=1 Tax=Trinickia sp. LjRoot230 TaxID=3342288 RepID=UPI003ECDFECE